MKIGFISLPVPGHLNPMTALARELQSRNRDVVLISLPDTEPFVRNVARLPFIPCCEKEFPAGSTPAVVRQMSRLQGQEAAQFVVRICAAITSALLKSLPRLINSAGDRRSRPGYLPVLSGTGAHQAWNTIRARIQCAALRLLWPYTTLYF